ncbi:MAG TPA: hypothetical protein VNO21_11490 [Polyangiaceae bacterium]|nr:hypothetical protein [Polyangiaceae bacterium]
MRLSKKSPLVFAAACVAWIGIGCSSNDKPSSPRAGIASTVGTGTEAGVNDGTKCTIANEAWPTVGDPESTTNPTLADGDALDQSTLAVTCTVKPAADGGFFVDGMVEIQGQSSFHIVGNVSPSGPQTGLTGTWSKSNAGTFQQVPQPAQGAKPADTCTMTYRAGVNPPVTAGRIWGTIICPHAFHDAAHTCEGTAEFRFENCTQE